MVHLSYNCLSSRLEFTIKALSKPTRLEQQRIILKLFDYHFCGSANKIELENKAARIATISTQPIYIMRESLQYLASQRWVAPGYTLLQDMVSRVVTGERKRIISMLQKTDVLIDEMADSSSNYLFKAFYA